MEHISTRTSGCTEPVCVALAAADAYHAIKGDVVSIDTERGVIANRTTGEEFAAQAFPEFLAKLIAKGGLVGYARARLSDIIAEKNG